MSEQRRSGRRLCGFSQGGLASTVLGAVSLAVAVAVVAGIVDGAAAARGVAVGALTLVVVFSVGMSITHAVAALNPALSLVVALLTYLLQLVLLLVVLLALERSTLLGSTLDRGWIGGALIVGTLLWSAALVRADLRSTGHYHSARGPGESTDEAVTGRDRAQGPPG